MIEKLTISKKEMAIKYIQLKKKQMKLLLLVTKLL